MLIMSYKPAEAAAKFAKEKGMNISFTDIKESVSLMKEFARWLVMTNGGHTLH